MMRLPHPLMHARDFLGHHNGAHTPLGDRQRSLRLELEFLCFLLELFSL
jgi:hypothetical protein